MPTPAFLRNPEVGLPTYDLMDVMSIQDAGQRSGWYIGAFDLVNAWRDTEGEGVTIAVLDTGADLEHPDLRDNLLPGFNMINPRQPPWDDCGHGSHVTGIMVALNNAIGMVGVAPKAKVVPIKVLDKDGLGRMELVAAGVRKAIELKVDLISMSLGTPMPIPEVEIAIREADAKGIPTFCAAGNAGTSDVFYPAAYGCTIAIGAIDQNFNRAAFSNLGRNLDFMCPGVSILSTVPKNWYAIMSGTSIAQPFACGIAALLKSACKKYHKNCDLLGSAEKYRQKFREHTMPMGGIHEGDSFLGGFGIIDVKSLEDDLGAQVESFKKEVTKAVTGLKKDINKNAEVIGNLKNEVKDLKKTVTGIKSGIPQAP